MVTSLADRGWTAGKPGLPGVQTLHYESPDQAAATPPIGATPPAHAWSTGFNAAVRRGQCVINTLATHKREGFEPDVILAHPGWGDAFYVRDFFPGARVVGLFEYFYRPRGADVGFDPEFPTGIDDIFRLHTNNATQLLALESCDAAICPTPWQKSLFPSAYQSQLRVIHEGIDTTVATPDPHASFTLPNGLTLKNGDEVLTFVSRSLEPYRGFHIFMRALPAILKVRPHCQVIIVGADGNSYGPEPASPYLNWTQKALTELGSRIDLNRVHFVGHLAHADYLRVLQVSRLHVYLTYPFILSWSLLEAMACGCTVLASDTAPVRDAIDDEANGMLFAFHSHPQLSEHAIDMLAQPQRYAHLGQQARHTICQRYDFASVSQPAYEQMLQV